MATLVLATPAGAGAGGGGGDAVLLVSGSFAIATVVLPDGPGRGPLVLGLLTRADNAKL
jgi:hypothetical protein